MTAFLFTFTDKIFRYSKSFPFKKKKIEREREGNQALSSLTIYWISMPEAPKSFIYSTNTSTYYVPDPVLGAQIWRTNQRDRLMYFNVCHHQFELLAISPRSVNWKSLEHRTKNTKYWTTIYIPKTFYHKMFLFNIPLIFADPS